MAGGRRNRGRHTSRRSRRSSSGPCRTHSNGRVTERAWIPPCNGRSLHPSRLVVAAGISGFFRVFVVAAHPGGQIAARRFVAALGCDVEEAVDATQQLGAAGEGRVGVENVARCVLVEDAVARQLVVHVGTVLEVVESSVLLLFFF